MAKFKGVERPCKVCGVLFKSPQSQAHVMSCSNVCGNKLRGASNKGEVVELQCEFCKKSFTERLCHSKRRRFCSKECQHASPDVAKEKSLAVSGPNNPMWKDGATIKVVSSSGKEYSRSTAIREMVKTRQRRVCIAVATPKWANRDLIAALTLEARMITLRTGIEHQVDHIVPLQSDLVCGLHWEGNLRVITREENLKKHNKTWPDRP